MLLGAGTADAGCNLIPVAERTFPSTIGSVGSPITAPGKPVTIRLTPCDGSPGFEPVASNNTVELIFQPPGPGADTVVPITLADNLIVGDCGLPGGRCGTLQFTQPDTSSVLPPDGLAGPARITVRDASNALVADIAALFQTTTSCDRAAERVFEQFTVLPKANSYADAANGIAMSLRATVDGSGSLLIPLDYWGGGLNSVLAETPGAPVAVFLKGEAEIPAMGAGDPNTIQQVLAAQPTPSNFVRSFTLNGRPLPPLLRVTNDGDLFGTSDTIESVIRVARSDGMGGPNLFDLSDRLSAAGRGPIIISTFDVQVDQPVPLQGLRSSSGTVAYTRDESREVMNLNSVSGDGDTADHVCQVVDAVAGTATNTGKAVTQTFNGFFPASALLTSDGLTAFLESEAGQNASDLDGDGGSGGNILRVFDDAGTDLTAAVPINASLARAVDGRTLAIAGSKVFFRTPGDFIGTQPTGVAGPVPPGNRHGIALSADGAFMYVTSGDDWISVQSRDPMTGALTFVESQVNGVNSVIGLDGAAGIAISPGGAHVYVAGYVGDSIVVFSRNAGTGALTFVEAQVNNVASVTNLDGPRQLAVSSDGAHVYAAAEFGNAIVAFSRNAGTGALTFVEAQVDNVGGVNGLDVATDVVLSPDGAHLYATGRDDHAVTAFSRNAGTGALTFLEMEYYDFVYDAGFWDAKAIAISPDGGRVYALGGGIGVFERDNVTGLLDHKSGVYYDEDGAHDMEGPQDVAVSPDNASVYVVSDLSASLAVWRSDPGTLGLSFVHSNVNGLGGVSGLSAPQALVVTPDGSQVYVHGGADELALFRTYPLLGTFDSGSAMSLSPQPAAEAVAAAADRAAILTPEVAAGVDLNGDSDALTGGDLVAQLYDASGVMPVITNLGVAASSVAISETLVAMTVREVHENQSSPTGTDLNDDGDVNDDVLAVFEIGTVGPPQSIGVAAHSIAVAGTHVVFLTSESDEGATGTGCAATIPPGGCDLNADGDADDRVLRIYDSATDQLVSTSLSVRQFAVDGTKVAFLVDEYRQGIPLNEDGIADDYVMHVYDLESGEMINTRVTGSACFLPGCEPTVPFKLKGDTVSFLTYEYAEGIGGENDGPDRNGDGDGEDLVLTVYSLASRQAQFVATVQDDYGGIDPLAPAPLPTEDVGEGTIVYVTAMESSVGEDVNGDGVIDDAIVVLLTGDVDEDGTFDDLDTCLNAPNPKQPDIDADRLGDDTCDPNIECPPQPLDGCRTTSVPGKSVLTIKNKDDDGKDSVKWAWSKGSATAFDDFPDAVNGAAVYSLCVYDESSADRRIVSSHVAAGGDCSGEPCWIAKDGKSFKFKDTLASQDGIKLVTLKAGEDGKAKIIVKGKGAGLALRDLPATTPVTAQLHIRDGDTVECWESTFSSFKKNDAEIFKAKE